MAKHPRLKSSTPNTSPRKFSPRIRIGNQDLHLPSQWPATQSLDATQFNEQWDEVRPSPNNDVPDTTDDSNNVSSAPKNGQRGEQKRKLKTHDQDPDFSCTSVKDLYYIPHKIVDDARDQVQDCIRLGQPENASEILKDALENLEQRWTDETHVNDTPWKIGMAEILIDQGRKQEAREVLSKGLGPTRGGQASSTPRNYNERRGAGGDDKFEEMRKMAEDVESELMLLDIYRRAEDWEKARETGEKLYEIDRSYFDLNEPMERFGKVRQILGLGHLKEIEATKALDTKDRNRALRQALEIYNHGCYATELYHEFFDADQAKVYGFDHSDCANIFFSAARVCYHFGKGGFINKKGHHVLPREFDCKPSLRAQDWRHQALHFLEKGRARALLDSIIRGAVIPDIPRRLLIKDMYVLADVAVRTIKKRGSINSTIANSRAVSMSNTVAQLPGSEDWVTSTPQSDKKAPTEVTGAQILRQLSPLQTSNLEESATVSVSNSPTNVLTPHPTDEEVLTEMKIHMRWRKALLYALTQVNPTLKATLGAALPNEREDTEIEDLRASIPSDTLVVEYALASTAPCGIMTLVVASDGVRALEWRDGNTVDIQNRIRELRASMASSDSRTRDVRPHIHQAASSTAITRPPGPERRASAVQQRELGDILRDLVVAPVKEHLQGKKKLIIIPSGDLAHVPWTIFFRDLPITAITVVPSLDIWRRLQAQANATTTQQAPNMAIVSNAPGDNEKAKLNMPSLRDIPFSRIEALYIARLHKQLPFIADNQDRKSFEARAKGTQILHICAHSTFDPDSPMSSSLQLFKEPLTMLDWHKLSIKADLVVFSSCLSGISKAYDSGSTIGFAHTLLGTGTRAFVGSLWPVDDAATLLLMIMFYEELRKPLPAADALYEAQKRMRTMTETDLHDLIDVLEDVAIDEGSGEYVIGAEHWIKELRELDAKELAEERYWAAFVLTGYGSRSIYPRGE